MVSKQLKEINFSVLDLAPILSGHTAADSFRQSLILAQHAEKWGYTRYWVAEHHNMPGVASSATSVVIGHIAAGTSTIRVGSGGIMLPNHAPLVIAEQFGTLESLFPGRIDLGLGRAPGTDQMTAYALRRGRISDGSDFPEQVAELRGYFNPNMVATENYVQAIPGAGLNVPIWLLGSSGYSAQLAAHLGLPFAYANHFSPDHTLQAIDLYRRNFQPSDVLEAPYVMVGVNVVAADTDEEASFIATSMQRHFLNLLRNTRMPLQPPVETLDGTWSEHEKAALTSKLNAAVIGDPERVKERLQKFLDETGVDEMIVNGQIYDPKARLRSYEIVSEVTK